MGAAVTLADGRGADASSSGSSSLPSLANAIARCAEAPTRDAGSKVEAEGRGGRGRQGSAGRGDAASRHGSKYTATGSASSPRPGPDDDDASNAEQPGVYEGENQDDKRHGKGKYTYANGDWYEGEWAHGLANGHGVFVVLPKGPAPDAADVENTAIGNNGGALGSSPQGVTPHTRNRSRIDAVEVAAVVAPNADGGSKYDGQWKMDLKDGEGTETFDGGVMYKGAFRHGRRHGEGLYLQADGGAFHGQFVNDVIQGEGAFEFANNEQYFGQWFDNYMHGFGTYQWPDGSRYEGNYNMGVKHGEGKFTHPNMHQVVCQWHWGHPTGKVVLLAAEYDGKPQMWQDGLWTGWCDRSDPSTSDDEEEDADIEEIRVRSKVKAKDVGDDAHRA